MHPEFEIMIASAPDEAAGASALRIHGRRTGRRWWQPLTKQKQAEAAAMAASERSALLGWVTQTFLDGEDMPDEEVERRRPITTEMILQWHSGCKVRRTGSRWEMYSDINEDHAIHNTRSCPVSLLLKREPQVHEIAHFSGAGGERLGTLASASKSVIDMDLMLSVERSRAYAVIANARSVLGMVSQQDKNDLMEQDPGIIAENGFTHHPVVRAITRHMDRRFLYRPIREIQALIRHEIADGYTDRVTPLGNPMGYVLAGDPEHVTMINPDDPESIAAFHEWFNDLPDDMTISAVDAYGKRMLCGDPIRGENGEAAHSDDPRWFQPYVYFPPLPEGMPRNNLEEIRMSGLDELRAMEAF